MDSIPKNLLIVIIVIIGGLLSSVILLNKQNTFERDLMSSNSGEYQYKIVEVNGRNLLGKNSEKYYKLVMIKNDQNHINIMSRFEGKPIELKVDPPNVIMVRELDGGYHRDIFVIGSKEQKSIEFVPK